jgi:hypothetical protein
MLFHSGNFASINQAQPRGWKICASEQLALTAATRKAEIGYNSYTSGAGHQVGNQLVAEMAFHYVIRSRDLEHDFLNERRFLGFHLG